jgi:hypothetical protein
MSDDAPKKMRLPRGRGIHKIEMPQIEETPLTAEPDVGICVEISKTDHELLKHIRTRLEAQYGTPFSNSQVLRWAVWHCTWNGASLPNVE